MSNAHRFASHSLRRTALWAALSLTLLGSAQALTLSRPLVQSRQGEPLKVEVDIVSLKPSEQVRLQALGQADSEVYKANRITPPMQDGQPLDIQVELLKHDNGRPYLRITSQQPITSSSLDLLLDLRWATGRTMREVSLSLDAANDRQRSGTSTVSSDASRDADAQQRAIQVRAGDTASALVVDRLPQGVSLDQMLLALLHNNPDAFVDDNVNRLKTGAVLSLPSAQEAAQVSREEAFHEILVQTQNFQAYRAELAARAPGGTLPKAERSSSGQLQAQVQNKSAGTHQDKLKLTRPKDAARETKIAEQRQAQDVVERAAELSRNINELSKIAAATAAATSATALPMDVPASAAHADNGWLDSLLRDPWKLAGAFGLLAGLFGLTYLLRRRPAKEGDAPTQRVSPLDIPFDLNLPAHDEPVPKVTPASVPPMATEATDIDPASTAPSAHRPIMGMPDISLDLDEPELPSMQERLAMADELWQKGQWLISRAMVEDVAAQTSGEVQEQARRWLAERG